MGATFAAVTEFFAADAAVAGAAEIGATAVGTAGIVDATAMGYAGLDAAAAATMGGGASVMGGAALEATAGATLGAAAGGSMMKTLGGTAMQSVVGTAVGQLMAPKPNTPKVAPVTPMPDPMAQQAAQKKSLVEQLSRRGRASTIMTSPSAGGSGKLGG